MIDRTIMPPLAPPPPVWSDFCSESDAARIMAEALMIPESTESAQTVTPAQWAGSEARKQYFRTKQQQRRTAKAAKRRTEIATNQRAFSGRVAIGDTLATLIVSGKPVETSHRRSALRAQFTGTLTCGDRSYTGHFVVLLDQRSRYNESERRCAEIVWTGSDWRVHIWRASPGNEQDSLALEIAA